MQGNGQQNTCNNPAGKERTKYIFQKVILINLKKYFGLKKQKNK